MDTQANYPTHTYPHTFNDDTDDSRFNEPWNPLVDNLDIIVLAGYGYLNPTEKLTYILIATLTRNGDCYITDKKLTRIQGHSPRTTYNALRSLKTAELITEDEDGYIILLQPNPRDPDFRSYIKASL